MREILFRGKRLDNGEWVYGCLNLYSEEMAYIIVDLVKNEVYEVDAKTVGQWTELEDKNGVKIFEGDIVIGTKDKTPKLIEWRGADFGYSNVMWNKAIEVTGNKY